MGRELNEVMLYLKSIIRAPGAIKTDRLLYKLFEKLNPGLLYY